MNNRAVYHGDWKEVSCPSFEIMDAFQIDENIIDTSPTQLIQI